MKYIAFVQARVGSERFPNKVLTELWNGKSVLEVLIERLKLSKKLDDIIVATTDEKEDLKIVELCKKLNIKCCNKGKKESALESLFEAYSLLKLNYLIKDIVIIDITADCPFIDSYLLDEMIEDYEKGKYDYYSNVITRSFPIGFDIQIYNENLLHKIYRFVSNPYHRVHTGINILNYLKEIQDVFNNIKVGNISAKDIYFHPDWRIVLDYQEDLILLKNIINYFNRIDFTYKEIIQYLTCNELLLEINRTCKQKIFGEK